MKNSHVIITGASSGIGLEAAKQFSTAGHKLTLLSRNIKPTQALNLSNTLCLSTDITDINNVAKSIKQAQSHFGPVDCLINNAGVIESGDFSTINHKDHESMIKVNLMGVVNCIECVLSEMQQRKSGTIINISSAADRKAYPDIATYAATKAAVRSLSESLCLANTKYGIRICNFAPAKVVTPMLTTLGMVDDQTIPVEDVAKAILWVYQQPESICIRDLVIAPTSYEF